MQYSGNNYEYINIYYGEILAFRKYTTSIIFLLNTLLLINLVGEMELYPGGDVGEGLRLMAKQKNHFQISLTPKCK